MCQREGQSYNDISETIIPMPLLELLIDLSLTWTSPHWRALFTNCFLRVSQQPLDSTGQLPQVLRQIWHLTSLSACLIANEGLHALFYLSAICHLQIATGMQVPPSSSWPYIIRGIKRSQSPSARVCLPFILLQLLQVWSA